METRINIREDLVISTQQTPEGVRYIVKDPAANRFFRFAELEGFILGLLDGSNSEEAIIGKVDERFKTELRPEVLQQFITRLRNTGLTGARSDNASKAPRRRRISGNLFYARLRLIDPDRLLGRMNSAAGFFFTKGFVALSALLLLLSLRITFTSWGEIARDLSALFTSFSFVTAWLIVFTSVFLHECAHGVTCKRYGGQVHDMGFLLIYFMPAFYCNVSDAWLFPEKSKRMLVTLAGAYFELFLWSLCTCLWRVAEPGTAVSRAALIVMATSGIKSLFNLNPLIKLDGYYLLSDYLEIPNLRRKAFGFLRQKLTSAFASPVEWIRRTSARERRIFAVYGALAFVYTTWLITGFTFAFGDYLMSQYHAWGFMLFAVFLAGMFQTPVKKAVRASLGGPLSGLKSFFSGPYRFLKFLGAVVGIAALLCVIPVELKVSGEFVILPVHNNDVRAEVEGIVAQLFAHEGDTLRAGDPIVRLANRDLVSEAEKVNSDIDELTAKLALLKAGARPEEISLAEKSVEKADEQFKYTKKDLDRDRLLLEHDLISKKEYDRTEGLVAVSEKELEESRSRLSLVRAGSRKEDIDAAVAKTEQLKTNKRFLDEQIKLLTVVSPTRGVVATHRPEELIGQNLKRGDLIVKVYDLTTITAEMTVSEKEIPDVKEGQSVALRARAYPRETFKATVVSIAPAANALQNSWDHERMFLVTARLDDGYSFLKSGMSGSGKISCGERSCAAILSQKFVNFFRIEMWSWW
jgi:multidrug resistance efflux pump